MSTLQLPRRDALPGRGCLVSNTNFTAMVEVHVEIIWDEGYGGTFHVNNVMYDGHCIPYDERETAASTLQEALEEFGLEDFTMHLPASWDT